MVHKHTIVANPRIKSLSDLVELDAKDMQRMLVPVDSQFRKYEASLFASQGAASGKPWPRLSPEYAKQKRKTHPGKKIMQRTGKLRKSLTTKGGGHVAAYSVKPKATLSVGTQNKVGAYHIKPKSGVTNALYNRKMPDRDVLLQSAKQQAKYGETINDHLIQKAKRIERVLRTGESEMRRRAASGGA
jgi:phage gpG-like protein